MCKPCTVSCDVTHMPLGISGPISGLEGLALPNKGPAFPRGVTGLHEPQHSCTHEATTVDVKPSEATVGGSNQFWTSGYICISVFFPYTPHSRQPENNTHGMKLQFFSCVLMQHPIS